MQQSHFDMILHGLKHGEWNRAIKVLNLDFEYEWRRKGETTIPLSHDLAWVLNQTWWVESCD